ncbi:hypothetical protein LZ30DRAFT_126957 [Colletotrichum cereale]|nr:hypothetical protein LZ30DRAFT_126957 [Colletotrichum cereale]
MFDLMRSLCVRAIEHEVKLELMTRRVSPARFDHRHGKSLVMIGQYSSSPKAFRAQMRQWWLLAHSALCSVSVVLSLSLFSRIQPPTNLFCPSCLSFEKPNIPKNRARNNQGPVTPPPGMIRYLTDKTALDSRRKTTASYRVSATPCLGSNRKRRLFQGPSGERGLARAASPPVDTTSARFSFWRVRGHTHTPQD